MASVDRPIRLENDRLVLEIASSFGPRITRFSLTGGSNVFAELGDLSIDLTGGQRYRLHGGHRLWVAPEIPEITYQPDDAPVTVNREESSVTVTQEATPPVNIEKVMQVTLHEASVEVVHLLTNRGEVARDVAPWAITQFPPDGTAVMPLPLDPADDHGLQPNAAIVVWPYSGVSDSPFTLDKRTIIIDTNRSDATKIGAALERGWLAYRLGESVFVKFASHNPQGRYLDMGASAQVYAGPNFTELETLSEQRILSPGGSAAHRETWKLYELDPATPPAEIAGNLGIQ